MYGLAGRANLSVMIPRLARGHGRVALLRSLLVAALFVAVATSLAALPGRVSTTSAAVLYVLAVTAASALAGLRAGLAASVLSFLGLNYFFTPPFRTLTVARSEDLVALVTFLVVSGIVGSLLSAAVSQRARAERREREALLLHRLGTRLLSGERLDEVLASVARAVTDLVPVGRCEITTSLSGAPVVFDRRDAGDATGSAEAVPIVAGGVEVGRIVLYPLPPRPGLSGEERGVVRTLANQLGLALHGLRLGAEASGAKLDAETNRLRAALFSSVTHDLRTPLASITASVTSLLDGETEFSPADRRELLDTIRQEADRLNRLVGNLLDLSRIRAGALVPKKAPAAIDEVIESVVARLQPVLAGREVRLMMKGNLPRAPVDVVQIDQVLTNLIENAAKFSPPGAPITVSATRWEDSVEVRVSDRGPGIPPEERRALFEPFARGEGERAGGTGLGLSIGRAIVASHGGKIWIEGSPGGGTTVVFQLPLRA